MPKTTYLAGAIVNHVLLGGGPFPQPSAMYVGLSISDVGTGQATPGEPTGATYARRPVTFAASPTGSTANVSDIVFALAGESWGQVAYVFLADALSGGNIFYTGAWANGGALVGIGDQVIVRAGALTLQEI